MSENDIQNVTARDGDAGKRVDVFVSSKLSDLTRSRVKGLIDEGHVKVNGKPVKASQKVSPGDEISVEIPPLAEPSAGPEDIPLDILFEDSDIIVVNKSAGLVVHPAAGHETGTLVNALLHHCKDLSGIGGELKAGIVHRLDLGTSGVIVAAKNDAAHHSLADQFQNRSVDKIYGALVFGRMRDMSGSMDFPIGRSEGDRKRHSSYTRKGREAYTEWRVLEEFSGPLSWLEVTIGTGRTHQIRVHLSEVGHPLVGDPLYGGGKKLNRVTSDDVRNVIAALDHPALHSWKLTLDHPRSGERMTFEAPIADDLNGILVELRKIPLLTKEGWGR